MQNVASVIVTYNRKELLLRNIRCLLEQQLKTDIIVIDNNSEDGTYEYLVQNEIVGIEGFKYINTGSNMGGAGGFYTGTKYAYSEGYEYVILMDDDGYPMEKDTFKVLYDYAIKVKSNNESIMLNSIVVCDGSKLTFGQKGRATNIDEAMRASENGIILNDIHPFNGTLVSRKLIERIGFPNSAFFIHGDEVDYHGRAVKAGAYVATVVQSKYYHPAPQRITKKYLSYTIQIGVKPPWKYYYDVRNRLYICIRDRNPLGLIKGLFFQTLSIRYSPFSKLECIKYSLKGIHHGLMGKLGKLEN